MLVDKFKDIPIILGSKSPRRKELLQNIGLDFQVIVKETEECVDPELSPQQNVVNIAITKNAAFRGKPYDDSLIITADTVVVHQDQILGKPRDKQEAFQVLRKLKGNKHMVYTAVALCYRGKERSFVEGTAVEFYPLSEEEIRYYIEQYRPFDKAGSYGIQEWIGFIGIKSITGSYENVVGLPTAKLYQELKTIF